MSRSRVSLEFYLKAYNISIDTFKSVCFNRLKNKFQAILITQTYNHQVLKDLDGFIDYTHKILSKLLEFDMEKLELQLNKENSIMFNFITQIIHKDYKCKEKSFTNCQRNELRLIHSDMLANFSKSSQDYLSNQAKVTDFMSKKENSNNLNQSQSN